MPRNVPSPGSGRRPKGRRPEGFSLPPWGDTEESVRQRLQAVSDAYYRGELDTREYDLEQKHARAHLASVGQEKDRGRLSKIREYLERIEAVALVGVAKANADRKHLSDREAELPDFDPPDPPSPH